MRILQSLIDDAYLRVTSGSSNKTEVYDKRKYQYLEYRLHARHVLLDGRYIEILDYSPDPRENICDIRRFDFFDEFLKYFFNLDFHVASFFDTLNQKGEADFFAAGQQGIDFREYQQRQKQLRLMNMLMVMSTPKFFFYNLILRMKVKDKRFFPWFTYTLIFVGYFLVLLFLVFFFLKVDAFFLIAIALLMFISSSYLKVELAYYEYKANKKISMDLDRVIGVAALIGLVLFWLNS